MSAFHASESNEMPRCPPSLLIQGHITEEENKRNGIPIEATISWRDKAAWPNSDAIDEMQAAELEDSRKRSASDVSQLSTASRQPSPLKIQHRG